jgi:copper/silver efflux system protein
MLNFIIKWSINNRFLILAFTFFLVCFGIYSIRNIPVDALPDLSDVQVIVKTKYPGQDPQVIEDQVTYPLSTAMLAVPGAVSVRAFSFFGASYVYVIFEDGTDLYWARSRVLEYLEEVTSRLPPQAQVSLGPDATGVGWVYEYVLVDRTGKHDLSQLTTLQNWYLKFDLQTVPGVSQVATVGGMVKEYQVTIQPDILRVYNLTIDQVKKAIQRGNQEVGGDVIELAEAEYVVRTNGYIDSVESLKQIPLGVNSKGTPILLADVAQIGVGPEIRRGVADLNGEGEVVGGIIEMRFGENAQKTIDAVKAKLKEIQLSLPEGVEIVVAYDRSGLIERTIETLKSRLVEEIVIVFLVCLVFLFHLRSSLVVVISLPIGVLCAFIIMYLQGINANIMSLGGIAIAVGAMVDAAVVMIENVHKHLEKNRGNEIAHWDVIKEATCEVGKPLFFSLLVITLSFIPIFTLQGQEGRLFSPLAFTKTYSMASAAILSITLVPVLMGFFIKGKIIPEEKNPINRLLIASYKPFIHRVLKNPYVIIIVAIVLMFSCYWPISNLGSEFMPELNEGDRMYMPSLLPAVSIGKGRQVLQQTNKMIMKVPEVKRVFGKLGRADTATDPAPLTMIETIVQLKPKDQWRKNYTTKEMTALLNAAVNLPGVTNTWTMPIKTRIDMLSTGIKTPIGIKIIGPSLDELENIGKQIESVISKLPHTRSVYAERAVGGRYINIDIDRVAAARFGLNIQDVQDVIALAVGGQTVTMAIEGLERYPVNIRYPQYSRDSLEKLNMLPIVTPTGANIPLADVANIYITDGPPAIKTENARPTAWVYIDIEDTDIGSYVEVAKKAVEDSINLPKNYILIWSGQYQYMERAKERLKLVLPLTLLIIIMLLYMNSKNLIEVFIVLGTLPLALVGGVWFIYALNYDLSIAVAVGFIALGGVSAEIGVIMLGYLNQAIKHKQQELKDNGKPFTNKEIEAAVINGSVLRVRPIVMTVSATIMGLLPIMIGGGTGSEIMKRIAAPMVGGMVSSSVLTLLLIPSVYYLWKKYTLTK